MTVIDRESEIRYELQHQTDGSPTGRWWFARDLGDDPVEAKAELGRVRALAEGNETGVIYRVVLQVRGVLTW